MACTASPVEQHAKHQQRRAERLKTSHTLRNLSKLLVKMPKKPPLRLLLDTPEFVASCAFCNAAPGSTAAASASRYKSVVALAARWSRILGTLQDNPSQLATRSSREQAHPGAHATIGAGTSTVQRERSLDSFCSEHVVQHGVVTCSEQSDKMLEIYTDHLQTDKRQVVHTPLCSA